MRTPVSLLSSLLIFASVLSWVGSFAHAATDVMSVRNGQLLRNGVPFTARGVQIVGRVAPRSLMIGQGFTNAWDHFGEAELAAAKTWNANLIRFQLSQPVLDIDNPLVSAQEHQDYIANVVSAINLARSMGFIVIASVQDQAPSGEPFAYRMPTASTLGALKTLYNNFGNDLGVMFGLFNEPCMQPTDPNVWSIWQNGGTDPSNSSFQYVGHQQLINTVRGLGAKNVLIVEGIKCGKIFSQSVDVTDSLGQLVYGVHPYLPYAGSNSTDWERNFGFLVQKGKAVVATEWGDTTSTSPTGWCETLGIGAPSSLLSYLLSKAIGISGWSFDLMKTIVTDYNGTPSTYVGFEDCHSGGGGGTLLTQQYQLAFPPVARAATTQVVLQGSTVTFRVTEDTNAYLYDWHHDNVAISGATGPSLTLTNVGPGHGSPTMNDGHYGAHVTERATGRDYWIDFDLSVIAPTSAVTRLAAQGDTVTFSATSDPNLTYQWRHDNVDILGATGSTLQLASVGPGHGGVGHNDGHYGLKMTNSLNGQVMWLNYTLTVIAPLTSQNQTVTTGGSATFSVLSYSNYQYEWRHNNALVPGTSGSSMTLKPVQSTQGGLYNSHVTDPVTGQNIWIGFNLTVK